MFPGFKCPVFGSLFSQNNEFFCWIFEQLLVGDLPDIVVGVPSRVVAHLKSGNLLLSKSLELLVIDEADLIFSFGYEDDLKTILKHLPEKGYQVNIWSVKNPILMNFLISQFWILRNLKFENIKYPVSLKSGHWWAINCFFFNLGKQRLLWDPKVCNLNPIWDFLESQSLVNYWEEVMHHHNLLLTDWFARKNVDDTGIFVTIFITGMNQVRSITDKFVPLQSGSVFYERAKLTGAQYKRRYSFIPPLDGIVWVQRVN